MTLLILACALPQYKIWWPFMNVLFYIAAPIPTLLTRRYFDDHGGCAGSCKDIAIFITMGVLISSFALPILLARAPVGGPTIAWGACYLTLAGNVVVYLTLLGFFLTFDQEDSDYNMW
ncbi:hypothetical protein FQA39_LY13772 [Lamprigera yunnana]|nr:hypothetical protein FQA39_LY13772 [Lamprigera yunnana]